MFQITVSMFGSPGVMESSFDMVIGTVALEDLDEVQSSMATFVDFYNSGDSSGSASPITGVDNIALDSSYFV